jgi:hypothetical protein
MFWASRSNVSVIPAQAVGITYGPLEGILTAYRKTTGDQQICTALLAIANALLNKLQTPGILQAEFATEPYLLNAAPANRIFPWISNYTGDGAYSFLTKCLEFTPADIALTQLASKAEGETKDYLRRTIEKYPATKIVLDQALIKMRLVAAKNPSAFRTEFLDKFTYNILELMQSKNAELALEFYNVHPGVIGQIYPEHVSSYPRPEPVAPLVQEANNPVPVRSIANFVHDLRVTLKADCDKLVAKYPATVTQQSVAEAIVNRARNMQINRESVALIQTDINLLNNPNSAMHYYLRGYVLSRLRTRLIVDLQTELARVRPLVAAEVGSSSTSVTMITSNVNNNDRKDAQEEVLTFRKNEMEQL